MVTESIHLSGGSRQARRRRDADRLTASNSNPAGRAQQYRLIFKQRDCCRIAQGKQRGEFGKYRPQDFRGRWRDVVLNQFRLPGTHCGGQEREFVSDSYIPLIERSDHPIRMVTLHSVTTSRFWQFEPC
jgi:hypothetical protein